MRKLTIMLAAALCAGVCSSAGWAEAAAPAPKMFAFNNGAEPETLDPALMTGVPEHNLAMSLFEGLVTYHPKTLLPAPGVARSWKISKDKRTYTFRLRESAWSNGDPVTSNDFVYAWRRVLEPATAAEYAYQLWYIKNARAYTRGKLKDFSKVGVRAPDAQTLEVTLEHPTAFFLGLLAFETFMPVHRGCVEKHGERWTRPGNIVSNGAFVLDKWLPQDRVVMKKNRRYWDAKRVQLDGVVAYAIADQNTALLRYRTGELHWIDSLPVPLIPKLMKRPAYRTAPYLGLGGPAAPEFAHGLAVLLLQQAVVVHNRRAQRLERRLVEGAHKGHP